MQMISRFLLFCCMLYRKMSLLTNGRPARVDAEIELRPPLLLCIRFSRTEVSPEKSGKSMKIQKILQTTERVQSGQNECEKHFCRLWI